MNRAQRFVESIPKGICEVKIVEREWGIERVYRSREGQEHCIPESLLFSSDVD